MIKFKDVTIKGIDNSQLAVEKYMYTLNEKLGHDRFLIVLSLPDIHQSKYHIIIISLKLWWKYYNIYSIVYHNIINYNIVGIGTIDTWYMLICRYNATQLY